jgi:citronellol/citronellal dehydrogenase
LAKEGANIAIVGKTAEPNPKLEGTIYTAAEEISAAGGNGKVLPLQGDIRFEDKIREMVAQRRSIISGSWISWSTMPAPSISPRRSKRRSNALI